MILGHCLRLALLAKATPANVDAVSLTVFAFEQLQKIKHIVVVPDVGLIEASVVDHTTVVHVHSSIFKNVSVSVVLQFGCSHVHQLHRISHQQGYRCPLFASSSPLPSATLGLAFACAWRVP
jgi:hypothetical protein